VTILEELKAANAHAIVQLGRATAPAGPAPAMPESAGWDSRPGWDNGPRWDNRPTWDNWSKR
jgi:hypothetical protein